MARLSDVPKILKTVGVIRFIRRVVDEVIDDNLLVWASALAYSWLFAIFPFFIFLLAMIPYLPATSRDQARTEIHREMADHIPSAASSMLWQNLESHLDQPLVRGPVLYLGLLIALWAASGGTSMTMAALDRCYDLDKGRNIYRHRLVAIILTVIMTTLLLSVLCLLPLATAVKSWVIHIGIVSRGSWQVVMFDVARWTLSLVLMVLILTVIYYNGPAVRQPFRFITPGAVFVVCVWVVLGLAFRLYVDRIGAAGYNKTYGTVGGVAILLLFFYIDALVLLIGAEINSEIDFEILKIRRGTSDFRIAQDVINGAPTSC